MARTYGDAFKFERLAGVSFYTSSTEKLLQARLMFARRGFALRHYSVNREPYEEDYALDTKHLLSRAIKQLTREFGLRSIFFVEDTSLRIDALSSANDFPGMGVKEWFQTANFDALRNELTERGNLRVAVKSDIALFLPTLSRPIFFHGETNGLLANTRPDFSHNDQYPWLTPNNFNGWFIPDGSTKRLGEMEFEESIDYDFRSRSLSLLIDYIEELNAAINLPSQFYAVRNFVVPDRIQPSLLQEPNREIIIVVGNKCAGKTTFSDCFVADGDVQVLEASTILRDIAETLDYKITCATDAISFLEEHGYDIVGNKIVDYIQNIQSKFIVISGLRAPEEILAIYQNFSNVEVVLVEADPRIRFERHVKRARDTQIETYKQFLVMDEEQAQFGIMRLPSEISSVVISNNLELSLYAARIQNYMRSKFDPPPAPVRSLSRRVRARSELHRCMRALGRLNGPAECLEISNETAAEGFVRIYNTNRALKEIPEFVVRNEIRGSKISYALNNRGTELLQLLDMMHEAAAARDVAA